MGRPPCCGDHGGLRRGPWTTEEDQKLSYHVQRHGLGNWRTFPKLAGLSRCGKSCRLRWANYLRPDIKRGTFSVHEDLNIISLHGILGNKWSAIASHLPGRTDSEIKNHWNTKLSKRLLLMGIDPVTHRSLPTPDMLSSFMASFSTAIAARLNSAFVEAQLKRLTRDYVNISHVSVGSADHQYLTQLSQILKLLGTPNNPVWAHPAGPLSSISRDQLLQPDALKWVHGFQNQINQGFVSSQQNDSTEYNAISQESFLFSDPVEKSKEKSLTISTDHGTEHSNSSCSVVYQRSTLDTEIIDWNSMSTLMPSTSPGKNDHFYHYSDNKSSSANSHEGGAEFSDNSIHSHEDEPFELAMRTSDTMSTRADLQEDESNYWADLFNSIEDINPDPNHVRLPLPSL